MAPYRILSLDGGGIRGVLTAVLLERMEAAHPGFLEQFDLLAGTSTGGLLALGLASGLNPTEARQLYEQWGSHVFADTVLDNLRDLGTLVGADYSIRPLKDALAAQFRGRTLGDLSRKVLVAAFDLDNSPVEPGQQRSWKAKFFHNFPGPGSDASERIVDVGIRTSAAPTYFPIYQGYIDGGVVANNPAMCGLAQALHPASGGQQLADVILLSLGTGWNPRFLTSVDGDWGLVQWAPHLVNLMLEGGAGLVDYQCRQILDERYLRVNPILPVPIGMDRVSSIGMLKRIARQCDLRDAYTWVSRYFV
jgi:uncharacterized protein